MTPPPATVRALPKRSARLPTKGEQSPSSSIETALPNDHSSRPTLRSAAMGVWKMPKLWREPMPMVRITPPQITGTQKLRCCSPVCIPLPSPCSCTFRLATGKATHIGVRTWLLRGPAAVDHEGGAGHQRRGVRGEEDDGAHEVLDLPEPPELDLRQDAAHERLVLQERPRHRRLDEGRADGVDADAVRPELDRHRLSEAFDGEFRGVVDRASRSADMPHLRRGVDDRAGLLGRDQPPRHG